MCIHSLNTQIIWEKGTLSSFRAIKMCNREGLGTKATCMHICIYCTGWVLLHVAVLVFERTQRDRWLSLVGRFSLQVNQGWADHPGQLQGRQESLNQSSQWGQSDYPDQPSPATWSRRERWT